jgi:hypothetical protein
MELQGGSRVVACRSICRVCVSSNTLGFSAPADTWDNVVPFQYLNDDLCLECFEKLVCDKQLELFHAFGARRKAEKFCS